MAKEINLDVVENQLENIVDEYSNIGSRFDKIESDYIEGTTNEWSTTAASKFIDNVLTKLNDFSGQLNTKLQDGLGSFTEGVNALAESQEAHIVSEPTLPAIAELSRSWAGNDTNFKVPDDYGKFTSDNLTFNVSTVIEFLGKIKEHVNTAVENGLDNSYCTKLRDSIISLQDSAKDVIDSYNKDTASAAVDEDNVLSSLRNNT